MHHCALCGRRTTQPAAFIGAMAVGPTCARKAGLLGPKAPPMVTRAPAYRAQTREAQPGQRTLAFFEQETTV